MNLQHERIAALCEELRRAAIAENYPTLAQSAVDDSRSFADFLESVLTAEKSARHGRTRRRSRAGLASRRSRPWMNSIMSSPVACRRP